MVLSLGRFLLDLLPNSLQQSLAVDTSCKFQSGGHGGIDVSVGKDNIRTLRFGDDPGYVEAEVACKGPAPVRLRLPWLESPQQMSCEDDSVRETLGCKAADVSDGEWPQAWQRLLESCKAGPQKILFLGLGGGYYQSYLAAHCPSSEQFTLEPNETVIRAARDYFGFTGNVVPRDATSGMKLLLGQGQQFDAIVSDMGQHPMSEEDLAQASTLLKPGGSLMMQWCYGSVRKHELNMDKMMDFFVDVSGQAGKDGPGCVFYGAQTALHQPVIPAAYPTGSASEIAA